MPLEGNVLLCGVDNQAYPVTVDALHTVFSPYGYVQKIAIFDKNGSSQALVQYPDPGSAANAKAALEGHAIYDGGYNRLKLSYSVHRELNVKTNSDRSWDYTAPVQAPGANQGASDAHASHGNGMHGYGGTHSGGHGGYGGTHSGGHGGGHSGGHARGGHEEPVLVTGADYEAAHDGIARAATAAAGAQRGGRGHGGRPAYQAPLQQSYQPQPSYQPAPVYGGQPAPAQQQQYYAPAQQQAVYAQPAPQAPAQQTYQAAPAAQTYQAAPAPQQTYQAAPAPQAYQAAPAAQAYQAAPAAQQPQYQAAPQQPQQHYAPAAPAYTQPQQQPAVQYPPAQVVPAQQQPVAQPVAAPQSGYVQQF